MQLELEKIKELKIKAMFQLEFFLTNRLQSNDSKQFKFVQTLSFWLLDYIKFQQYKTQPQIKYKKYKRGDVIKANFGHRVGSEHGGLHYAIVIDNDNALGANTLTVIPLSSRKPHITEANIGKDRLIIGAEIYKNLIDKLNKLNSFSPEAKAVKKELFRMKAGTIALVGQITTISKYRIYDPLSTKNALHGIRVSDATLDLIDSKIKELFTHSN